MDFNFLNIITSVFSYISVSKDCSTIHWLCPLLISSSSYGLLEAHFAGILALRTYLLFSRNPGQASLLPSVAHKGQSLLGCC